ncbi:hypothetical protein F4604DRAFT_1906886 [Suillus subluteus]|nr:hypothetical protein F4604DRAFT_1906886 [Suillus subluteus]
MPYPTSFVLTTQGHQQSHWFTTTPQRFPLNSPSICVAGSLFASFFHYWWLEVPIYQTRSGQCEKPQIETTMASSAIRSIVWSDTANPPHTSTSLMLQQIAELLADTISAACDNASYATTTFGLWKMGVWHLPRRRFDMCTSTSTALMLTACTSQFAFAQWPFLDAAILSAHAHPPYEDPQILPPVDVQFADWVPGICLLLGMLIINLIDNWIRRDNDRDSTAVFAFMAGGLTGSVSPLILKYVMMDYPKQYTYYGYAKRITERDLVAVGSCALDCRTVERATSSYLCIEVPPRASSPGTISFSGILRSAGTMGDQTDYQREHSSVLGRDEERDAGAA